MGSVVAAVGGACSAFAPDLSRVIALEVFAAASVEETDTLRAHAIPVTAAGDSTDAPVYWVSFDTTILAVADSARGLFTGRTPGTTTFQVRTGNLRSSPIAVTVTAAADTLAPSSSLADTVSIAARDSVSDSLGVVVADTATNPPNPPSLTPLAARPVIFAVVRAPPGATVTLVTNDTTHTGAAGDTLSTNSAGLAAVQVRYLGGGTLPDSVVVTASARRAVGTLVAGTPVTFVVQLRP